MIQVGTALESYDDIIASEAGKFFSGVKSGRFSNLQAMIWKNATIEKIWSCFSNFGEIFGGSKQILKAQCVQTLNVKRLDQAARA